MQQKTDRLPKPLGAHLFRCVKEIEPLQLVIRKLVVYGCDSFQKRRILQEFMERNGAVIQDYLFNFKTNDVIFRFSLRKPFESFQEALEQSEYALNYEIISPKPR